MTQLYSDFGATARIHPTAIVAPGAMLGEGTTVGAYSIIGPHVVLGKGNVIGPHVVLDGHTTLGDENVVYQFASVGAAPQDLKYRGEASTLVIGNKNIIREYVTLQPGTSGGGMKTGIGDGNLFMVNSHVGHDSFIGNHCIFANSAALSGHVTIGNRVVVGGLSGIHQYVRLGDMAMIGAGAMVAQDIPPFCMAQGDRAKLIGLNKVGMERGGVQKEEILSIRKVYRFVLVSDADEVRGKTLNERVALARATFPLLPSIDAFLSFVENSPRGVARPRASSAESDADAG
jgi:UDP-N-acetylglucosamine acyltransferase